MAIILLLQLPDRFYSLKHSEISKKKIKQFIFVRVVTQCQPEDTHREFNKNNRHELFLKSSLSAKGRRSTDPITNFRAKVRTSPRKPETPLGLHS